METIIKTYKDRLINLSSKNRSLVMKKLYKKRGFDLTRPLDMGVFSEEDWDAFLLGRLGKRFVILDDPVEERLKSVSKIEKTIEEVERIKLLKDIEKRSEQIMDFSNQLNYLSREIDSIEKETGKYELFVGYPFVEGCFNDGTFIRGPLLLFPVTIEKKGNKWTIGHLKEQDVLLNKVFIYAHAKYNGVPIEDMDMAYSSLNEFQDFENVQVQEEQTDEDAQPDIGLLVTELRKRKINIQGTFSRKERFVDLTNESLPKYEPGQLVLKSFCVLGQYPLSNAIYVDYQALETKLLENGVDYEGSSFTQLILNKGISAQVKSKSSLDHENLSESLSHFMSDLDHSQELAVAALNHLDQLVIYGPPGTGKSQTISNMISNALAKGQKVLMVSQKRAALDVIYNRLSDIQSKLVLIHDSEKDKGEFYNKVAQQLLTENLDFEHKSHLEIEKLSMEIDAELEDLKKMGEFLLKSQESGLSFMEMVSLVEKLTDINDWRYPTYKGLKEKNIFDNLNYNRLQESINGILKKPMCTDAYKIIKLTEEQNQWIGAWNPRLTLFEKETVTHKLNELIKMNSMTESVDDLVLARLEKIYKEQFLLSDDEKTALGSQLFREQHKQIEKSEIQWWNVWGHVEQLLNKKAYEAALKAYKEKEAFFLEKFRGHCTWVENKLEKSKVIKPYLVDSFWKSFYSQLFKNVGMNEMLGDLTKAVEQNEQYRKQLGEIEDFSPLQIELLEFARITALDDMLNVIKAIPECYIIMQIEKAEKENDFEGFHKTFTHFAEKVDRLDKKLSEKNQMVPSFINSLWNDHFQSYMDSSAFKEFKRQAEKKRQLWPIRKYLQTFQELAFHLIPCWLLSPETVSQLIPLEYGYFDLVIFDEASQMFVENALPTIFRGKKVVVAGDSKQLKPTSIFSNKYNDNEDDEKDIETIAAFEEESLLDLAKINYQGVSLNYHYRSRYEELINFSNYAFYEGKLNIAPNIEYTRLSKSSPIEWVQVQGKWVDRKNSQEANKVVEIISDLLLNRKNGETIGVITFNITQKDLIEDLLEARCQYDKVFKEAYLEEIKRRKGNEDISLFVKNIENVQGDERDIIIFSIGYAPNEAGKIAINFGSLSQDGGENRLNVAISRSKKKVIVVASILPDQLKIDNAKNQGAKLFKTYLQYAKAVSDKDEALIGITLNQLTQQNKPLNQSGSDMFVTSLYEALKEKGYEVFRDLGISEYRIDLAILDPTTQKFVLGIECDTRIMVECPSVRERDLHRKRFLESRGWNIIRLFSLEWWQSKDQVLDKIAHLLQVVKHIDGTSIQTQKGFEKTVDDSNKVMDNEVIQLDSISITSEGVCFGDHVIVRDNLTKETFDVTIPIKEQWESQSNGFLCSLIGKTVNQQFVYDTYEYMVFAIEK